MLLHHARRPARTGPDGRLVPLAEQDRSLWNTRLIAEGVELLHAALARDRLGEFQAQAAIAALHADARTVEETDWVQIVGWYDELVVEGDDLPPVGVAYVASGGVHGVDRGEDLVATRSHPGGQALTHQPMTLGDQRDVPGPTVLLVKGDQFVHLDASAHP